MKNLINITDTTLSYMRGLSSFSKRKALAFLEELSAFGISSAVIPAKLVSKVGNFSLPYGLKAIYQADNEDEYLMLKKHSYKPILMTFKGVNSIFKNEKLPINIIVEIQTKKVDKTLFVEMEQLILRGASALWISGISFESFKVFRRQMTELVEKSKVPIYFNPCNDLAMATALAVEAAGSRMGQLVTSFGGVGSHASTEQVQMFLLMQEKTTGNASRLPILTKWFEAMSGEQICPNKPVVGKAIFYVESGIHVDGIVKNPITYEPYPPEMAGLNRKLVIGKHSGKKALVQKLSEMSMVLEETKTDQLLERVRTWSITNKRGLTDSEFFQIAKKM